MNQTKLLLGALAIAVIATGCPAPVTPPGDAGRDAGTPTGDGGRDTGTPVADTGVDAGGSDAGTDAAMVAVDGGVPVTCAAYCMLITTACTGANVQYTDMTACNTACTNAGWTMGNNTDVAGNTLGCRVYHAGAAGTDAATHCPHAGPLGGAGGVGGGPCSPFRGDVAVEGHPTATAGAYVRVDRMGMPAVATALVGPGHTGTPTPLMLKDAYNDSSPAGDVTFLSAPPMLEAMGAFHALLDADLGTLNFTPCSMTHAFPVSGLPVTTVPACVVQRADGTAIGSSPGLGGTVASVIIPDTLRINQAGPSGFPNGRQPGDDVINPTLALLLLNLSPCAGSPTGTDCAGFTAAGMTACNAHAGCNFVGATCSPAATSRAAVCAATPIASCMPAVGCIPASATLCVPAPCEAITLPTGVTCPMAQTGCSASTCAGSRCTLHSFDAAGLSPHMGAVAPLTTFPYFAPPN